MPLLEPSAMCEGGFATPLLTQNITPSGAGSSENSQVQDFPRQTVNTITCLGSGFVGGMDLVLQHVYNN